VCGDPLDAGVRRPRSVRPERREPPRQRLDALDPLLAVARQRLVDDLREPFRDVAPTTPERDVLPEEDRSIDRRRSVPSERRLPRDELVQNHPDRPDVCAGVDLLRG